MILELKIKNFLSFKDEVIFSFEATRDKSFEEYQVEEIAPNVRILRLAILYGANASGKSNLIEAFEFLRYFWLNKPESKDASTGVVPFLLDKCTPNKPSEFSIVFYIEGVKYMYSLELDKMKVLSERLFIYPGTQPALIFSRVLNNEISEITFNPKRVKISQTAKDEISLKCLVNTSVIAAYNQVNVAIKEIDSVVKWIKQNYNFPCIEPTTRLISNTESAIFEDKETKEYILNFLHMADFNITDIISETIRDKTITLPKTEFEHCIKNTEGKDEFYFLEKKYLSRGALRAIGLSGMIYKAIKANSFIAIDEIESSLHPRLVEFIIEDFLKQKGQSQLLLTTHYDGLLEEDDLLRKDSVWFTAKKENGSTELYSLADFKGVNRISSLRKAYKYGKFGAVPKI